MNNAPGFSPINITLSSYVPPIPIGPPLEGIHMPSTLSKSSKETIKEIKSPIFQETLIQKAGYWRPLLIFGGAILGASGIGLSVYAACKGQQNLLKFGIPLCLAGAVIGSTSQVTTGKEKWKNKVYQLIQQKPPNQEVLSHFIDNVIKGSDDVKVDFKTISAEFSSQIEEELSIASPEKKIHLNQVAGFLNKKIYTHNVELWKKDAISMLGNLESQELQSEQIREELRNFIFSTLGSQQKFLYPFEQAIGFISQQVQNKNPPTLKSIKTLCDNISDLFSLEELKTGRLNASPPVQLEDKLLSLNQKILKLSSHSELTNFTIQLQDERLWRLYNLNLFHHFQTQFQPIQHKDFPDVKVWFVGARKNGDFPFEMEVAEFAHTHKIVVLSDSHNEKFKEFDNTILLISPDTPCTFPQDFVDFKKKEVCFPALSRDVRRNTMTSAPSLEKVLNEARYIRFQPYAQYKGNPKIQGKIGNTFASQRENIGIGLAQALGACGYNSLTYSEGGNTLIGHGDQGPFIIVGYDSFVFSKYLMETDLGHELKEEDIFMAFSVDSGIPVKNIHFIEQPGDFHLDMNMALLGSNIVVVNDAVSAAEQILPYINNFFSSDIQEITSMTKEFANVKKQFEDKAAADLEKHNFKVIRFPGKFDFETPNGTFPITNFFNFISATAPTGKKILVAMGCPNPNVGIDLKELFQKMTQSLKYDDLIFLDYDATRASLLTDGGISCRTKPI